MILSTSFFLFLLSKHYFLDTMFLRFPSYRPWEDNEFSLSVAKPVRYTCLHLFCTLSMVGLMHLFFIERFHIEGVAKWSDVGYLLLSEFLIIFFTYWMRIYTLFKTSYQVKNITYISKKAFYIFLVLEQAVHIALYVCYALILFPGDQYGI